MEAGAAGQDRPRFAPDGQAYLFVLADVIVCFVRPKGGL
jgi:hypothetical protein